MAKKLFDYFVDVKNKKGTSDRVLPAGCNSWLQYWEKTVGKTAEECTAVGCSNKGHLHGSHVFIDGATAKEYIVPLCASCNLAEDGKVFSVLKENLISAQ